MKYKIAIPLVVVLSITFYFVSANSGNMKKISRNIHNIQDVCEDVHLYMAEHSESENDIYTQKLALDIEKYMKKLAENYKKLNSADSIQIPLRAYLDTWTTEKIHQSLLVSD
ncbi:MAG: hypothetical protein H7Y00_13315, partial [Fimbriimonadaceae bacterium]|nr:hypothetical protein [Chitinophagales bacterium]